jgi:serine/threonine protein kinase
VSPTAIREIGLLRELHHPNIVALEAVHISRADASISLAFDYAEHDLYEMIWHHRDRVGGEGAGRVAGFACTRGWGKESGAWSGAAPKEAAASWGIARLWHRACRKPPT